MISLEALKKYGIQIDSFSYRGIEVAFYEDVNGHQLTAIWDDRLLEFGVYNTSYREDMKMVIDDFLDTVTRFEEYPELYGSKLEYFQNGSFSDIRLIHKGRVIKLYLCKSSTRDPALEAKIQKDAIQTLHTYIYC